MPSAGQIPQTPEDVVQFSGDQFMFAVQLGNAAGGYRMPLESPAKFGISLATEDGRIERFQFTDGPENRFGLALKQHFGGNPRIFGSLMLRWFALQRILRSAECQLYIRPVPNGAAKLVHSSVFEVAGSQQLNASWEFDDQPFFARVAEIYALDPN